MFSMASLWRRQNLHLPLAFLCKWHFNFSASSLFFCSSASARSSPRFCSAALSASRLTASRCSCWRCCALPGSTSLGSLATLSGPPDRARSAAKAAFAPGWPAKPAKPLGNGGISPAGKPAKPLGRPPGREPDVGSAASPAGRLPGGERPGTVPARSPIGGMLPAPGRLRGGKPPACGIPRGGRLPAWPSGGRGNWSPPGSPCSKFMAPPGGFTWNPGGKVPVAMLSTA
mmetsp:Transcript_41269/g.94976  ORF Transcript_41269/g.94976 Transcript_41269/m.94976 type:complete len:229 (-) Transcript_41269:15-701(-)